MIPQETTYKIGEYKYLVKFGAPTNVRILKNGVQHDEKNFPTEQHFIHFLNTQLSLD